MAKRQNFGFQKRQKEADKQKKKEEKAERKRARREEADDGATGTDEGAEADEESDPGAGTSELRAVAEGAVHAQARGAVAERAVHPTPRRAVLAEAAGRARLEPELATRLEALCEAGWDLWDRFDNQVRRQAFHPFVAADYPEVLEALIPLRAPGLRFLEWGSATGVITIMADLLGFEAYGIELDPALVDQARELARVTGSGATFTAGSLTPTGYRWRDSSGDERLGTIGHGESGYLQLGMPLEEFDVVFGYPWPGEAPMMLDLMRVHGRPDAVFLLHGTEGVQMYRGGRAVA